MATGLGLFMTLRCESRCAVVRLLPMCGSLVSNIVFCLALDFSNVNFYHFMKYIENSSICFCHVRYDETL